MRSQKLFDVHFHVLAALSLLSHLVAIEPACAQQSIPYFGEEPPGKKAKPFAKDFFTTAGEAHRFGMAITDDGKERYYAVAFNDRGRFREEIRFTRYENGKWTAPKPLLDEESHKYVDPHLSPDGKRLYFIYTKPPEGTASPERPVFDIWYVNREGNGWSAPINLASPISRPVANDYYVSLTADQTVYFGSNRADAQNFDLFSAKLGTDGKYQKPLPLRGKVNTNHYEADVFVSPDESYLVFSSNGREDGMKQGDLYVSFRSENGTWSRGINMGKQINSDGNDFAPSISRDGKYLFYSRGGVINWVDSSVIEDVRSTIE